MHLHCDSRIDLIDIYKVIECLEELLTNILTMLAMTIERCLNCFFNDKQEDMRRWMTMNLKLKRPYRHP